MKPLYQLGHVRRLLKVSQAELGARVDLPQQYISALERGQPPIDVAHASLIARALGVEARLLEADHLTICTSMTAGVTIRVAP